MKTTCITKHNFVNWILSYVEDLQLCKTINGDIVIRVWTNGVASIVSEHGKDLEAGETAFAALVNPVKERQIAVGTGVVITLANGNQQSATVSHFSPGRVHFAWAVSRRETQGCSFRLDQLAERLVAVFPPNAKFLAV